MILASHLRLRFAKNTKAGRPSRTPKNPGNAFPLSLCKKMPRRECLPALQMTPAFGYLQNGLRRITISGVNIEDQHPMADDAITRHFFNGFIRLHLLYHAAKDATYGAEITEELIRHGYRIGSGTLYPTLHLLEERGYLRSRMELVNGRRRKYYRATPAGKRVLAEAREKLLELVAEVLEDKDQPFQTMREERRQSPQKRRRRTRK
jgi:DNA-binding PadR family transcriptional regulator